MIDNHTYRVTWSAEDGEYLGLCLDFRSLSWLAADPGKAFDGIRDLVQASPKDMRKTGEKPPEPLADRTHGGKFVVHVRPETHRRLVLQAAEEGVSLNRIVSERLSE